MYKEDFLINERDLIREIVNQFDPNAEIFLFGPGIKNYGRKVDVYIKSECLTTIKRWEIKQKLDNKYFMSHVEMVCGIDDEKLLENLKVIGLAI